ncbi:putative protein N(5)-glutamine methyltransferase [Amycolatopsis sp. CA-230715]|uniref:putative protein N(5)-glutamine methyltransferase n=1 Tax=Amycolatopsis sp. CA-230715 TaxID=2745196 RepID=UPI001C011D1A|nr:putative protein N(5)-glutamine methyltransferase [Amycolatopsis sp. CA-230715]QWF83438.1 Release factor glutamine methyltransferase [Amycolatopsis sp. CA-230715]
MSVSESAIVAVLRGAGCVFAEDEARLLLGSARDEDELARMVRRRTEGVPLEVVVGWVEFHGRRIVVEPGVFVPRRRTELLVRHAVELAGPGAVVVDLCCGTGALGAAVEAALGGRVELHAADIDPVAVRCARRNVTTGEVHEGDLYDALPESLLGRVDLLLVNAPYVPSEDIALMPPEAREHEPRVALDGGPDGVDLHRRVAMDAPRWLAPGGYLLVETSERQAERTAEALSSNGFRPRVVTADALSATVVLGRLG